VLEVNTVNRVNIEHRINRARESGMNKSETRQLIRLMAQELNEEKRYRFDVLGEGGHYSEEQKKYVFNLMAKSGIRATARILQIPRRTIQRWCTRQDITYPLSVVLIGFTSGLREEEKHGNSGHRKDIFTKMLPLKRQGNQWTVNRVNTVNMTIGRSG